MKSIIKNKILLITCILLLIPIISIASEDFYIPEYTEEYQKWQKLSDEEKEQCIEPTMYEMPEELQQEDKENSSDQMQVFSNSDDENVSSSNLPSKYINTNYGSVKDQGSLNSCWSYSATTVFETNYFNTNSTRKVFSNLHMDYISSKTYNSNGFNRAYNSGGNINIALACATNGMGIVLESSMPSTINSSTLKNVSPTSKVSDYELLYDTEIKDYIYSKNGVVSGYTYIDGTKYFSSPKLYNNSNLAYYCSNSDKIANHAITIIGWDDNYTNSAFNGKTGAYIVLNSYGSSFGDKGIYYILYDDVFLNDTYFYGVTKTDDIDYDNLYQYDTYGPTVSIKSNIGSTIYASNVFTKNTPKTEILTELGIFFPTDEAVTIYINTNGNDKNINNASYKFTTEKMNAGYHTIELPQEVELTGNKFTVTVKSTYAGIEYASSDSSSWYYTATSNTGESFISTDGKNWIDMKNFSDFNGLSANACIKVFTKEKIETGVLTYDCFDYKYYADHNLDLYKAFGYNETELRNHWQTYGKAEGRAISAIFDPIYYIENNSDLKAAFGSNYVAAYNHFITYGYSEYRASSPTYSGIYYKNNNSDLANMSSLELITHYINFGKAELRKANTNYDVVNFLFDATVYAALNPDVYVAFGNNSNALLNHWYIYGINEGRIASLVFDPNYYIKANPDVAKAYSGKYAGVYEHFVKYGFAEGRQGTSIFSVTYYLSKNSDIKKAFGTNYLQTLNHFINLGKNELRMTSSIFNLSAYRLKNVDLKNTFKTDYEKYYIHYLQFGKNENRVCI